MKMKDVMEELGYKQGCKSLGDSEEKAENLVEKMMKRIKEEEEKEREG